MTRNVIAAAVDRAHEDEKRERLNAAAPELLLALKGLLAWLTTEPDYPNNPVQRARAAIAKAENRRAA